jgi:hypothetical protein
MPSQHRGRVDALLAAYTTHYAGHIIITDLDALIRGIGDLIAEAVNEAITDTLREQGETG